MAGHLLVQQSNMDCSSQWPQLYLLQSVSTLHHKGSLTLLSSLSICLLLLLLLFLACTFLCHCWATADLLLYCGGNEYHCLPNMHGFMQPNITLWGMGNLMVGFPHYGCHHTKMPGMGATTLRMMPGMGAYTLRMSVWTLHLLYSGDSLGICCVCYRTSESSFR